MGPEAPHFPQTSRRYLPGVVPRLRREVQKFCRCNVFSIYFLS